MIDIDLNKNHIIISPEARGIFEFLMNIDKEVENLLNIENNLLSLRSHYLDMLGLIQILGKKLQDNQVDFKYNLSDNPENVVKLFNFNRSTGSKVIVLFAYIDTLYHLHIAYTHKVYKQSEVKNLSQQEKNRKLFIKKYLLNKDNQYFGENEEKFKMITYKGLIDLRNSLTHLFSVCKNIILSESCDQFTKIKGIKNKVACLTPNDLHNLTKDAGILMLQEWAKDEKQDEYDKSIKSVIKYVEENAAIKINVK